MRPVASFRRGLNLGEYTSVRRAAAIRTLSGRFCDEFHHTTTIITFSVGDISS